MIIDYPRDSEELKKLFKRRPMQTDVYDFNFIIKDPYLYCFYDEDNGKLLGFIFITEKKKKLFLSGVSKPKQMSKVINAIISICKGYEKPMYSNTDLRPAIIVLKKAGFKRIRNTNIYKRSK